MVGIQVVFLFYFSVQKFTSIRPGINDDLLANVRERFVVPKAKTLFSRLSPEIFLLFQKTVFTTLPGSGNTLLH